MGLVWVNNNGTTEHQAAGGPPDNQPESRIGLLARAFVGTKDAVFLETRVCRWQTRERIGFM
jgi:hypothetical protein